MEDGDIPGGLKSHAADPAMSARNRGLHPPLVCRSVRRNHSYHGQPQKHSGGFSSGVASGGPAGNITPQKVSLTQKALREPNSGDKLLAATSCVPAKVDASRGDPFLPVSCSQILRSDIEVFS